MQNRYAGDIGDFGKYGLLRALAGRRNDPRLGVVWYLTHNEDHNNDGKFTSYLEPTARNQMLFRSCDPELYDSLGNMVRSGQRSVEGIRTLGILPASTAYHETPVAATRQGDDEDREPPRRQWADEALQATRYCGTIFIDPDNGLTAAANPKPKHASVGEGARFAGLGKTLVAYHHISRQGTAHQQVQRLLAIMEEALQRPAWALLYHRGSARAFIIAPGTGQAERLESRTKEFLDSNWRRHFEIVGNRRRRTELSQTVQEIRLYDRARQTSKKTLKQMEERASEAEMTESDGHKNVTIAISGPMAAGKTTLAALLEQSLGFHRLSTREALTKNAEARPELQDAGAELDRRTGGGWVMDALKQMRKENRNMRLVAIDAVRSVAQIKWLKTTTGRVIHVHLTAEPADLRSRFEGRNETTDYDTAAAHRTESENKRLEGMSDLCVNTSLTDAATTLETLMRVGGLTKGG